MANCFLYPGQGAQYPGMGRDLWEKSDKVKKLFKTASESTSMDLEKLLFEGSADDLKATDKTQLAITLVNVASALLLKEKGIVSDVAAGFSLGEVAAFWDAGIISSEDLFPLVRARGKIMEAVSRSLDTPEGSPGMAAVIGMDYDKVAGIIRNGKLEDLYIANYNSPVQIVLSGTDSALNAGEQIFKEQGARRYIRLKVSGPFHCPLMKAAETEYAEVLKGYSFSDPVKKVFSNVTGEEVKTGEEARELCSKQLTSGVLWVKEEKSLLALGIEKCLEVGPGTVLAGLWKAVGGDIKCLPAGTAENILNI